MENIIEITKEIRKEIEIFVLETSKHHVLTDFDKKDRRNKTINFINRTHEITIHRNCYPPDNQEDYLVHFKGIIKNIKFTSTFYLEWEDKEQQILVPINTKWNPSTNSFSNRSIKIKLY